jgi:hypothetical protein
MLTQLHIRGRVFLVLALFAVIGATALWGQAVNGTISGTVIDPSGAAIAGATVEVKNTATQVVRNVTTNAQGRFTVPELFVGNYDVRVSMAGFQNSVQTSVPVVVGGERTVDFAMKIGQAQETVTVEAQAAQVDTSSSAVSTLVETKQVEDLPLNGRNYTQLITLAPGVQAMKPSAPGFYGTGEDYSVGGARPEGQAFLMDNSNVQDFWNHGPGSAVLGTTLGVDAIAEFSIQTNTYSAQFGGSGAAINAVTKSGTNAFHGTLFEYLRNSDLDARAFYDPAQIPAFHRNQFGGSIGGPIVKNKLFFFFNYEGLRNDQGLTEVAFVPTAAARVGASTPQIAQILSYYPLPSVNIGGGVGEAFEGGTQLGNENYLIGRVDYNISASDSIFTRYVSDRAYFHDPFSGGPIPDWPETHHTANQYATVEERHIISPSLLNLARVSFVRTREGSDLTNNEPDLYFYPSNLKNGTLAITGLSPLGSSIFLPFYFVQNKFGEGDDLYWTLGKHSLRFGVDVERVQSNLNAPGWLGGEYSFSSLGQFLAAQPTFFLGPLPNLLDGDRDFREIDVNSYVQDDWKVSSRFTVNIGLRYEFVTNPVTDKHPLYAITNFATSTNWQLVPNVFRNNPSLKNFDPRIGFAYSPFSDNKTSIRGGFGIFHDPISPRTYASAYYFDPPFSSDFILFPTFPYPNFGAAPGPSQSNGVDYNTDVTPYIMQYNFNIQREIAPATILQIGYVGSKGVHLFYQADRNAPVPFIGADGHQVFGVLTPFGIANNPRQNPALGSFNSAEDGANSVYNSLQVTVNRRFQKNVQGQMSYTWSHCIDDSSSTYGLEEGGFPVQNPYNMAADRASCAFDRRHSLIVSALWQIPFHGDFPVHQLFEGWQVSGITTVHSGIPFNVGDGFDQAGTGNIFAYDRPNLNPGYTAQSIVTGTLNQWYNPNAFSLSPVGELGNFGRNVLTGPFFWDIDFSVIKDTKLTEHTSLQFRAEFFNIFNHPDWGQPNQANYEQTCTPTAGSVCTLVNGGYANAMAGTITTLASNMRQIQFALKLIF